MMPELPMIWEGVSRWFPWTTILSTAGVDVSCATSAAEPPRRGQPARRIQRKLRISKRRMVSAPGSRWKPGARLLRLGACAGQCPEDQPFTVWRHIDLDLVPPAEFT